MYIFDWFNNTFLKMTWLNDFMGWVTSTVFRQDPSSQIGAIIQFFLYDTVKIFLLLSFLIFSFGYLQTFFPPERTRKILGRYKGIGANLIGALLGTVTPFCSCSSIPIFIGFTSAGLPIGVTFSFLISSPLVDLASVVLLASVFNWKIAMAYVIVGIVLAVISGSLISKMHMEDQIESFVYEATAIGDVTEEKLTRKERIRISIDGVKEIVRKVWIFVLLGVGLGALIHNVIPEPWITAALGADKWYSVPLGVLIGLPIYADIFGTLPVAEALVAKGVGIGTVLAFMMSVTTISLPSLVMLKQVVKSKLMIVFVSLVVVGIIIIGFLFNAIAIYLI